MRQMYDAAGALQFAASYDPYGVPFEQFGLGGALGFTGEHTDANGLQYLRARYYNPSLAMFLSRDPVMGMVGGQSIRWNPYIYAGANPVNYVDPDGEFFWLLAALPFAVKLGLGVGAAAFALDAGGQIYGNLRQGMWLGDAIRNVDGWGSLGRAAEWGINVAVGYGTGGILNGLGTRGVLTAGRAWVAGAVLDAAWGIGWDMGFHRDNFGAALGNNLIGFGLGEFLGLAAKGIGRGLRYLDNQLLRAGRWYARNFDLNAVTMTGLPVPKQNGVKIPTVTPGPRFQVGDDIVRFDNIPRGSDFDIALGVGENVPSFAATFSNPDAYWWKEWPEWLYTDKTGKVIPIAQDEYVIEGVKTALDNFNTYVPSGKIRFNLEDLTTNRKYTMAELAYIWKHQNLRNRTLFYSGGRELAEDALIAELRKLGVK